MALFSWHDPAKHVFLPKKRVLQRRSPSHQKLLLCLLCLFLLFPLSGCGKSKPTQYYAFTNTSSDLVQDRLPKYTLRVARVNIPQYLEREAIVERTGPSVELSLDSLHVWAEPLGDGVRRLIHHTLTPVLLAHKITVLPLASEESGAATLLVDIVQLDGARGKTASLTAQWSLLAGPEHRLLDNGLFSLSKAVNGERFADLVQTEESLVRDLSVHLAGRIPEALLRRQ